MRADSCVSVCQPFLVLPPLFDSNLVELFNTHKESAMRTTFLNTHSLFYPSTLYGIVDARISRYFKKLTIGERSVKALVPLLAYISESFYC